MASPCIAHIGWLASCHLRRRMAALAPRECASVVYTDSVPEYLDVSELPYRVECLPPELLGAPLESLEWLEASLARHNVDVLHSHSTHFPASLGLFCQGVIRVNSIWDFVYALDPLSPLYHQAVLEGLESGRLAEAVSFSSPVARKAWVRRGYPAERALLHSWGVDLDLFRPSGGEGVAELRESLGIHPEELVILSSRTTSLPANLDILIQAAVSLRKTLPVRLVVIGGAVTREARYLEDFFREKDVRETVVFAGSARNDHVLRRYYEMARVVASIHSNDHNPATVLEALAVERPVVVCDIPTVAYWARNGETGFAVPHRDVAATARTLRRVLTLPQNEWEAMGRRGRELVSREADFSRTLDIVQADYARLARLGRGQGLGDYGRGLLLDMRGKPGEAAAHYRLARESGKAPEMPEILEALLREKTAVLSDSPSPEYFLQERAQPGVVAMAAAPEDGWPDLARHLPAPQSLFRHDFIAGTWPLAKRDPEACLRLLGTLAARFESGKGEWLAETVQWFGGVLGQWEVCGKLLNALPDDGGTTLAIHALACARELGPAHALYRPLLEKALVWSGASIAHIDAELDRMFRADVNREAQTLLDGRVPEGDSVIEASRVYATTDRSWIFLSERAKQNRPPGIRD